MSDAVVTVSPAGLIHGWSRQAERLLGWKAQEVVGRGWADTLVPEADREASAREFLGHLAGADARGPAPARWEFTVRHKDGHEFPVEVTITSVSLGGLTLFCAFLRDITDRRAAERARRTYEDLVQSSGDAIITKDLDGVVTSWNPGAEHMYGYVAGEMLGRSITAIVPSDKQAEEERHLARVRRGERVDAHETERLRKDGTRVAVSNMLSPIRRFDGVIVGISSITRDLSLRKRAEAERDLFFALSLDLLCLADLDGFCIRLNPSWERALGFTERELLAQPLFALVHPDDEAAARAGVAALARGIPSATFDARCRCKDGSYRWFSWSVATVPGRPLFLGAGRDVTDHRRLEEQFRQAQKMEAVGRLAAGVAHDFNNLLTVMLGTGEFLLDALGPDHPNRPDAQELRQLAVRASGLTAQLLAFARKQVLAPRILDLNALVSDVAGLLRRLVGEDITLKTVLAPDLGRIDTDPGQLEQVIINLAVNARDAMPRGGSLLLETADVSFDDGEARSYVGLPAGRYVMLAVTDTGTGMDAETKSHIFEPFFTTKPPGTGTGLGLATVFGIVEQSGGRIFVYSEPGLGTTFKIYFPRADRDAVDAVAAPPRPEHLDGTETILVVEDEDALRHLTRRVLEAHGYRVLVAGGGAEALEVVARHAAPIDLVVSDVVMPGMAGPELVQRLAERQPDLRALFVSGYTDESIAQHKVFRPGVNYLAKPFSREGLAERVRAILDQPYQTPGAGAR